MTRTVAFACTCHRYLAAGGYTLIAADGACSSAGIAHYGAVRCAVSAVVVLIPPILVGNMVPTLVALFTIVSNVELMKKNAVARDVVLTQYTTQGIRALRM